MIAIKSSGRSTASVDRWFWLPCDVSIFLFRVWQADGCVAVLSGFLPAHMHDMHTVHAC